MEVHHDEDSGFFGLLGAVALQPLWVFMVQQRSDHCSLVVNWKQCSTLNDKSLKNLADI